MIVNGIRDPAFGLVKALSYSFCKSREQRFVMPLSLQGSEGRLSMKEAYYESLKEVNTTGILFSYLTLPGGFHPLHWHDALELLYPLNGETDLYIEGDRYHLPKRHLIAVESRQVHSVYAHNNAAMFICIHISKKHMQIYFPGIELYQINCYPENISDEEFPKYLEICKMMETLTRIYITDARAYQMEADGILLQVLARLIRDFSTNTAPGLAATDALTRERIHQVITYVEENFRSPISLSDISDHVGLGKEYFCRFFKKNMGISFFSYLNEIRLAYAYQDLVNTDLSVMEIMEKNGITNQKLFNQTFKKLYGCTPSSVRKKKSEIG